MRIPTSGYAINRWWLRKPPNWGGFNSFSSALCGLDVCDGDLAGTAVLLGVEGDFLAFD
jgi:hypothetical protein